MRDVLTAEQARVLGALLEKEHTTPDYYPLTLNALVTACNQKSNREPVMALSETDALHALDGLRDMELAWVVEGGGRVSKYEENIARKLGLTLQEVAVLCLLLLRGPQTVGEIRGRSGRVYPFEDIEEVSLAIEALAEREDGPLVVRLPLLPGRKEARYMHLLCGEIDVETIVETQAVPHAPTRDEGRLADLERRVAELETELATMRDSFEAFRAEFE